MGATADPLLEWPPHLWPRMQFVQTILANDVMIKDRRDVVTAERKLIWNALPSHHSQLEDVKAAMAKKTARSKSAHEIIYHICKCWLQGQRNVGRQTYTHVYQKYIHHRLGNRMKWTVLTPCGNRLHADKIYISTKRNQQTSNRCNQFADEIRKWTGWTRSDTPTETETR